MKEADYEPEEGEIQDDDGQEDMRPAIPELLGGGKGRANYFNSYCLPLFRGDFYHRQTESLHVAENIHPLGMEWACNSHPSRVPRFRVNGIPNRHFYNRPCVKESNPLKPASRSTVKECRQREAFIAASKIWHSSFNASIYPYGATNNVANSGQGYESVSNKWSHYSKSARSDTNKKKWTRYRSTEKKVHQQKHGGRGATKCENTTSHKNENTAKPEQPSTMGKIDMKESSIKESCQDNVMSDSSDSIEIIEVPKKVPELITIDGSDDELDNGNESSSKAPDENSGDNVTNPKSINKKIPVNEEYKSPFLSESLPSSQEKVDEIGATQKTVENCQEVNNVNSTPGNCDETASSQYETHPPHLVSEESNIENLSASCGLEKNSVTITSHSPPPEEFPLQNSDSPARIPPESSLIDGDELPSVVESTNTQLQILNEKEISTVLNDASKNTSDSKPARQEKKNNTDENSIKKKKVKKKSMPSEYISYLGNTGSESQNVFPNKKITTISLGHVLSNRFHSDGAKVTQSQYATVYFDRLGANNSKCRKYEEPNYKFSVTVPELIISLGKDSDSGDDSDSKYENNKDNHKPNLILQTKKNILTPAIPVDFEKKLDVLLKQARYQQEENTQKIEENRYKNETRSHSLPSTHQHFPNEVCNNEINKNTAIPQSCARVLPSLKNINSKSGKNKSRNSMIKNPYTNSCHERINGNGLYVKAARKLVSKSVDRNNQVNQSFNKRYQSQSKVINQTPCLKPGINIGLLSPHKQREYIKLKRKLVQLTCKTKDAPCTGKHKVVTSTRLSLNENKPEEIEIQKAAMTIPRQSVIKKSNVSCESRTEESPQNLSPKSSSESQASNSDISSTNLSSRTSTANANNADNANNVDNSDSCSLESANNQPITDHTDITNEMNVELDVIISEVKETDNPIDSNELVEKDFQNSASNNTEQNSNHVKESEDIVSPHTKIQEESKDKSPQAKRKSSSGKNLSPVQKKQCTTNNQIKKNLDKPTDAINMIPYSIISADGKLAEQLWSSETRLIAKRRQVLEDIATVRLNLHKIEVVNFKRNLVIEEIEKLKEQLKEADLHLSQKSQDMNILDERVGDAKQNIQKCQSELLSLTLECEELGCKVHGPNYNVPNTCADLIRNEMTAMTEAIQLIEIQKKPEAAQQ